MTGVLHSVYIRPQGSDDYIDITDHITAILIDGDGTGEQRGILADPAWWREPTPIERALTVLAPHLARHPLYRANSTTRNRPER